MIKFITLFACFAIALAAPGLITEHHAIVQEPVLTKVGSVVHTAPSAVSHQSFSRVHNRAIVAPVVTPLVKHTVHSAPIVTSVVEPVVPIVNSVQTPVVHTVHAGPVVKTVEHVAPVVHAAPVVPVVQHVEHVVPVSSHAVTHQSHVQLHSNAAAVVAPVVHASPVVHHTVPVVHAAPAVHVVHH